MNLFNGINILKVFFEIDPNNIDINTLNQSIFIVTYLLEISKEGYAKHTHKKCNFLAFIF